MKASDWISVKDKLPKIGQRVLMCRESCDGLQMVVTGFFLLEKDECLTTGLWDIDDYGYCDVGITHWQPIVLPIKEKK